jgi:hypothetical protein
MKAIKYQLNDQEKDAIIEVHFSEHVNHSLII